MFLILKSVPSIAGTASPSVTAATFTVTFSPLGNPARAIGILIVSVAFSSMEAVASGKLTKVSSARND